MPKKILLADDSITIQKVVELTFSDGDYEVVAVNNGAKAIQKLSELRPDIILSDIIMPERNGYEVCEYVKSHPDLRTIPVVLLTGTFEPFDPDRADKAGCDAVVTKPFESQSLIHKVEELIQQSQASAAPLPASSSWIEEPQPETFPAPPPPPSAPVMPPTFDNGAEIFGSAAAPAAPAEMPFEEPATPQPFSGEPSAFESADFGFGGAPADAPPPAAEPSPWEEQPAFGGETRAFPTMSFDDLQQAASNASAQPEAAPAAEPSPWDDQPAFGGETSAFPTMSFDDLSQATPAAPAPAYEAAPAEPSPWEEQPAFGAETTAFPKMGFDDLASSSPAEPAPSDDSPWNEPPSFDGETRAFEKVSFDDIPRASAPETAAEPSAGDSWGAPPAAAAADSPWEEQPIEGGETKAFATMSFDELSKAAESTELPSSEPSGIPSFEAQPASESADSLWEEPEDQRAKEPRHESTPEAAFESAEPTYEAEDDRAGEPAAMNADSGWDSTPSLEEPPSIEEPSAAESLWDEPAPQPWSTTSEAPAEAASMPQESFSTAASPLMEQPGAEDMPFAGGIEVEQDYAPEPMPEEPLWTPAAAATAPEPEFADADEAPAPAATAVAVAEPAPAATPAPAAAFSGELSDEQIEKIARRVVELLTDKVVRDIAWEVIPDTARMVVRDRIRELEAEA